MMTDALNATADALKAALLADMSKVLEHEAITHESIYERLIFSSLEDLEKYAGPDFAKLSRDDQHRVVAMLLHRLKPDDGIELHRIGDVPIWLRVIPASSGRLPPDRPREWRYVRLDAITEVTPKIAIRMGSDPEEWQYVLSVTAGGNNYHPSIIRFRGSAVKAPLSRLLRLIARRVVPNELSAEQLASTLSLL